MGTAAAQTVQRRTVSAQFRSASPFTTKRSMEWILPPPANQTRSVPGSAMSLFAAPTRFLPFGQGARSTRPMAHPCFNNPHLPLPFPRGPLLTFNRQRPQRRSLSAFTLPLQSLPTAPSLAHTFLSAHAAKHNVAQPSFLNAHGKNNLGTIFTRRTIAFQRFSAE